MEKNNAGGREALRKGKLRKGGVLLCDTHAVGVWSWHACVVRRGYIHITYMDMDMDMDVVVARVCCEGATREPHGHGHGP